MIIDYLWHSEFMINIKNWEWKDVKIMSDSWLSNYAFWDLMARNPTIKIDYTKLENVDAIFISHSHCDHFDPYTLFEMYKNFNNLPVLLIPETLKFLIPLIEKYLPNFTYKILRNKEEITISWIKVKWLIFENDYITNEDDVMTLFVYNDTEIIYAEVDTLPPEIDEIHKYIFDTFTSKKFSTVLYIATRNELEWNIKLVDMVDLNKRKAFASEYIKNRKEEIERNYAKFEAWLVEHLDIQSVPKFCKAFIWQWICYPAKLDKNALKVKVLWLEEVANLEKKISNKYNYNFPITHFEAWCSYEINNSRFIKLWKISYLKEVNLVNLEADLQAKFKRFYSNWPINNEKRDEKNQEKIILNIINNRFLPYQLTNLEDPLKNIILTKKRDYTIKINYWFDWNYTEKFYSYWFWSFSFNEISQKDKNIFDEDYYANDLEDFIDWRQELYSNFWHKLNPKCSYRLWTMLWTNFLNNDIVYKKYELHFERAISWKNVNTYVEDIYKKLI